MPESDPDEGPSEEGDEPEESEVVDESEKRLEPRDDFLDDAGDERSDDAAELAFDENRDEATERDEDDDSRHLAIRTIRHFTQSGSLSSRHAKPTSPLRPSKAYVP